MLKKLFILILIVPFTFFLSSCNRGAHPMVSNDAVAAENDFLLVITFVIVEDLEDLATNPEPDTVTIDFTIEEGDTVSFSNIVDEIEDRRTNVTVKNLYIWLWDIADMDPDLADDDLVYIEKVELSEGQYLNLVYIFEERTSQLIPGIGPHISMLFATVVAEIK